MVSFAFVQVKNASHIGFTEESNLGMSQERKTWGDLKCGGCLREKERRRKQSLTRILLVSLDP